MICEYCGEPFEAPKRVRGSPQRFCCSPHRWAWSRDRQLEAMQAMLDAVIETRDELDRLMARLRGAEIRFRTAMPRRRKRR